MSLELKNVFWRIYLNKEVSFYVGLKLKNLLSIKSNLIKDILITFLNLCSHLRAMEFFRPTLFSKSELSQFSQNYLFIWIQNENDICRKLNFVYYLRVSKKSLTWYELRLMHRTFGNLGMTISIHYRTRSWWGLTIIIKGL